MKLSPTLILAATAARLTHAVPHAGTASSKNETPGPAERDLIGGVIGGLAGGIIGVVKGILGSVAEEVNPDDLRPDAAHPFIMPGPTDQRGPCPVTLGQVIDATADGFNMATDLSTLLGTLAVAFSGNLETLTFSIGGEDNRTYSPTGVGSVAAGHQFGLDAHSRIEGDASATKQDFFLNNGDVHNGVGSRFANFVKLAEQNGGQFSVPAANALYKINADYTIANNPRGYSNLYTLVAILGEYPFLPNFFANGTYLAGGTANYESLSSLLGFQLNSDGSFCYVPERFPKNWYRRSTPYGIANGLVPNLVATYMEQPFLATPLADLLKNPTDLLEIGCALYQALFSEIPASLVGSSADRVVAAVDFVQHTLLPTIDPVFGCTIDTSSTRGVSKPQTQDSLQETRPGGGQQYGVCSA